LIRDAAQDPEEHEPRGAGSVTASEFSFLALGLILGAVSGAAIVELIRARPSAPSVVRLTVAHDAIPRRATTLADDAFVAAGPEPARGGPADPLFRVEVESRPFVQAEQVFHLPRSRSGDGPAAIAQQLSRGFQLGEIVSDGDRGNAKGSGQGIDVGGTVALDQVKNLAPSMLRHRGLRGQGASFTNLAFTCVYFHGVLDIEAL